MYHVCRPWQVKFSFKNTAFPTESIGLPVEEIHCHCIGRGWWGLGSHTGWWESQDQAAASPHPPSPLPPPILQFSSSNPLKNVQKYSRIKLLRISGQAKQVTDFNILVFWTSLVIFLGLIDSSDKMILHWISCETIGTLYAAPIYLSTPLSTPFICTFCQCFSSQPDFK